MPFGKRKPAVSALQPLAAERAAEADAPPAASLDVDAAMLAEISPWRNGDGQAAPRFGAHVKNANIVISLIARAVIIFAALAYMAHDFLANGDIDQIVGYVVLAMLADYARVLRKALR